MEERNFSSYMEDEQFHAGVLKDGEILIVDKSENKEIFFTAIFDDNQKKLIGEGEVLTQTYITPNRKYCIITFGIGLLYIIDMVNGKTVKTFEASGICVRAL